MAINKNITQPCTETETQNNAHFKMKADMTLNRKPVWVVAVWVEERMEEEQGNLKATALFGNLLCS